VLIGDIFLYGECVIQSDVICLSLRYRTGRSRSDPRYLYLAYASFAKCFQTPKIGKAISHFRPQILVRDQFEDRNAHVRIIMKYILLDLAVRTVLK
jgi:hypothetical protein